MNYRPMKSRQQKQGVVGLVVAVAVVVLLIGGLIYFKSNGENSLPTLPRQGQTEAQQSTWQVNGPALEGTYADADVVSLSDGRYRMYLGLEPEAPNFAGQIYSAVSEDGVSWELEDGERKTGVALPDVLELPDGRWRMYFQDGSVIKSAVSEDGINFADEPGTRIGLGDHQVTQEEMVSSPAVVQMPDGTYLMVYGVSSAETFFAESPNPNTTYIFWATSDDGLNFQKQGMAVDTRNDTLMGFADTPDIIIWDDGEPHMFFWSYTGVFESVFEDGAFTTPRMVLRAEKENKLDALPANPPGDPGLIKIGDEWFMYVGYHTRGLFYANLE